MFYHFLLFKYITLIMTSKQEPVVLKGQNYGMWEQDMEMLLKSEVIWHFTKIVVQNPNDDQQKFIIDRLRMRLLES